MAEQIWTPQAEFSIRRMGRCVDPDDPGGDPDRALALHQALLAVSGEATRSLGASRRRGMGWVTIHSLDTEPTRDQLARLLKAPA